jgi:hypothetical protein
MPWVIRILGGDEGPGFKCWSHRPRPDLPRTAQTPWLHQAEIYDDENEARLNCCEGEVVVTVSDALAGRYDG